MPRFGDCRLEHMVKELQGVPPRFRQPPPCAAERQPWATACLGTPRTLPAPEWGEKQGCTQGHPALDLSTGRTGPRLATQRGPHASLRGRPDSHSEPTAGPAPEPVGSCLYLVTLGGFASSTGIWHPRWKISLVRSPWKQAEPLRRFTLNGVHPACTRCPVHLEFPPRLREPLGRPGASLPQKASGPCPCGGRRQP